MPSPRRPRGLSPEGQAKPGEKEGTGRGPNPPPSLPACGGPGCDMPTAMVAQPLSPTVPRSSVFQSLLPHLPLRPKGQGCHSGRRQDKSPCSAGSPQSAHTPGREEGCRDARGVQGWSPQEGRTGGWALFSAGSPSLHCGANSGPWMGLEQTRVWSTRLRVAQALVTPLRSWALGVNRPQRELLGFSPGPSRNHWEPRTQLPTAAASPTPEAAHPTDDSAASRQPVSHGFLGNADPGPIPLPPRARNNARLLARCPCPASLVWPKAGAGAPRASRPQGRSWEPAGLPSSSCLFVRGGDLAHSLAGCGGSPEVSQSSWS